MFLGKFNAELRADQINANLPKMANIFKNNLTDVTVSLNSQFGALTLKKYLKVYKKSKKSSSFLGEDFWL